MKARRFARLAVEAAKGPQYRLGFEAGYGQAVMEVFGRPHAHPNGGHVCLYRELDGTTAGACHLPGKHGGRLPDGRTADELERIKPW